MIGGEQGGRERRLHDSQVPGTGDQLAAGALAEVEIAAGLGRDAKLTFGHTREMSRLARGLGPDKSGQTSLSNILWLTLKCSKCS